MVELYVHRVYEKAEEFITGRERNPSAILRDLLVVSRDKTGRGNAIRHTYFSRELILVRLTSHN